MGFDMPLKDIAPAIGVIGAALIGALATLTGVWMGRRNAKDATTATLNVSATSAAIEADKVQLTDRQYQAQREQMATEITAKMGEMYNRLLTDANTTLDRLTAEVAALKVEVAVLTAEVAACEKRSGQVRARLARIEWRARAQGWELE